jgi:hypothetical protein
VNNNLYIKLLKKEIKGVFALLLLLLLYDVY